MLHILLFLGSYASFFIMSFISMPIFAFVLYQAVYFFNPDKRWWGTQIPDLSYSFFTVVLMAFLLLIKFKEYNANKLLSVPQLRWAYILVFLYALASFYAVSPDLHQKALTFYFKLIVIISIAYKLCDTCKKLDIALYGYIFGAWYISFYAFQTGRNSGIRVEGIGTVDSPDANGLAAAIAPSAVIALYYFWVSTNKKIKMLMLVAGAFIANAIVLINSRGAFLAVAASAGYFMCYMYFSKYQRKYQKLAAVGLTIFGLAGTLVVVDASFIERITGMTEDSQIDTSEAESGATRFIFWKSAIDMSFDHPFGAGYQGFNAYAPIYIPADVNTGGSIHRTVHSSWFETLTEIGYLGLFAFIMMIYSCFRTAKLCKNKLVKDDDIDNYFKIIALEAALIAFIVAMTFLNRMRAEILYWCVLYIACAYNIYVLKAPKVADTKVKNA